MLFLGVGLGLCWSLPAAAQDRGLPADTSSAERHFKRGYALAEAQDYDAAALEFEQAYAVSPHHSVLYNLGMAYSMAGRHVQAVKVLRGFLAQAESPEPALVERAKLALAKSERYVGSLRLRTAAGARVTLDGQPLGESGGELLVATGAHGIWVEATGYRAGYRNVIVEAGKVSELEIELEPVVAPAPTPIVAQRPSKPQPMPPHRDDNARAWSYALGGTAVLLGTSALAIYARNSAAHREWQVRRDHFAEQESYGPLTQSQRDELAELLRQGTNQQRWDDLALGLGIGAGLSLSAAVVLFWKGAPSTQAGAQRRQLSFDGRRMVWSTTW